MLAVYGVVAALLLRDAPGRTVPTGSFLARHLAATLRLRVDLAASALYAVAFGGYVAFSVYLPTYLKTAYGLTQADAAQPDGRVRRARRGDAPGRRLAVRPVRPGPGARRVLRASRPRSRCSAATPTLLPLGTVAFLGHGGGARRGVRRLFALVARWRPAEKVGAVTGVVGAAGGLGGFVPPLVMGAIYGATGGYALGLLLLALVALAAAALYTWLVLQRPGRGP